jgi:flagellum-specific peptidoglycan hydrolase FlgJ
MATEAQLNFLSSAARQAKAAGHIFPEMAACEAALESTWGTSEIALRACNLFGQKQSQHPIYGTFDLPTREYLHGAWTTVNAAWVAFPTIAECFAARMDLLRSLAPSYPNYEAALRAGDPETYVREVSKTWSTDPARAAKCIVIYNTHKDTLDAATA